MFVVDNNLIAVVFCIITMLCWGSWANTQKAVGKRWRFELFYWDYVFGVVAMSLTFAFAFGSVGAYGRSFLQDLAQADSSNIGSALLGGVVFNAANILLVAAIALSGMAVAFPVGIGLALVLGVLINYVFDLDPAHRADPLLLFAGVALVTVAIVLDAGLQEPRAAPALSAALRPRAGRALRHPHVVVLFPRRSGDRPGRDSRPQGAGIDRRNRGEPATARRGHPSRQDDRLHRQRHLCVRHPLEQSRVQHGDHVETVRGRAGSAGRLFQGRRGKTISGVSLAA